VVRAADDAARGPTDGCCAWERRPAATTAEAAWERREEEAREGAESAKGSPADGRADAPDARSCGGGDGMADGKADDGRIDARGGSVAGAMLAMSRKDTPRGREARSTAKVDARVAASAASDLATSARSMAASASALAAASCATAGLRGALLTGIELMVRLARVAVASLEGEGGTVA
jgi:hypothetical protein